MTTPRRGINSVGKENTPVFLEKGKLHSSSGALLRRAGHSSSGAPPRRATFPSLNYSPSRPKYFCTTGVFSFPTKFILLLGIVILLVVSTILE